MVTDFDLLPELNSRSPVADWGIGSGVALFTSLLVLRKFSSSPDSHWARHHPGEATFPGLLFLVLTPISWTRRSCEISN
jgi:hypothetical protein